jgi:ankyrin repeat domain-containing protein 50
MAVGRSAPRYQEMANLYPRSMRLQASLSEYFLVSVELCHQLLKLTRKSIFGQLVSFLSESDLKTFKSNFELWATSIKEEITLLGAQSMESQRTQISALSLFSRSETYHRRLGTHNRILDACSKYDYQASWKRIRKNGNVTLLTGTLEYQDWKMRVTSSTLLWLGPLGSGKSVLLANIIDDLSLMPIIQHKKAFLAYFFCRNNISESLEARTILGSLARQLLGTEPSDPIAKEFRSYTQPNLGLDNLIGLLGKALDPMAPVYIVLDGLDECSDSEREAVITHLRKLQETLSLVVCLSGRLIGSGAKTSSQQHLSQLTDLKTTIMPRENPDVRNYIDFELEQNLQSGKLKIGQPTLILDIQTALTRGAEGMFLWAVLQIESLCSCKSDEEIYESLAELPKDLPETYSRILKKIEKSDKNLHKRVFQFVVAACRCLSTQELRVALSVVPWDLNWNPLRLVNDIDALLSSFGGLILVDEEDEAVALVHHSLKQFLLQEPVSAATESFTHSEANGALGAVLVTYLNYDFLPTELSCVETPKLVARSMPSTIIESSLGSSRIQELALKLLRRREKHDFDIGRFLMREENHIKPEYVDRFYLSAYAKSYWHRYIGDIYWEGQQPRDLITKCFDAEPAATKNHTLLPILLTATMNEHIELLRLLFERYQPSMNEEDYYNLLLIAIERGSIDCVYFLARFSTDFNPQVLGSRCPIHFAIQCDQISVVEMLIRLGMNIETRNVYGQTSLIFACELLNREAVSLLLKMGANLDVVDSKGKTPFMYAEQDTRITGELRSPVPSALLWGRNRFQNT